MNNAKCTNITNEGILNMWVDKNVQGTGAMTATKDYGVAALQCSKFGGIFAPQHTRFFPGMRIEEEYGLVLFRQSDLKIRKIPFRTRKMRSIFSRTLKVL